MTRLLMLSGVIAFSLAASSCAAPRGGSRGGSGDDEDDTEGDDAGECSDGADNDGNGAFDCDDEGCQGSPDCGGGDDDDTTGDDDDDDTVGGDIDVSVTWPMLELSSSESLFPTYMGHLTGSSIQVPYALVVGGEVSLQGYEQELDFACLELTNETGADATLGIEVDLVGYSSSGSQLISVPAGQTAEQCLSPVPDLTALHALNSEVTAQARVTVTQDSVDVFSETLNVSVTTRNDVLWGDAAEGDLFHPTVATMVQPSDPAVTSTVDDVAAYLTYPLGVGGYRAERPTNSRPVTTQLANYVSGSTIAHITNAVMMPGETLTYYLQSDVIDGPDINVVPAANLSDVLAGDWSSVLQWNTLTTSNVFESWDFTNSNSAPLAVAFVTENWDSSDHVTLFYRQITAFDDTYDYGQAVFNYLRDEGFTYVNLPVNYLDSSQRVSLPGETLAATAGNCIDGTILFASYWEAMGLKPLLYVVPGHAFVGMWMNSGRTSNTLMLETTAVGGSMTPLEAILAAEGAASAGAWVIATDVGWARDGGLLPIP